MQFDCREIAVGQGSSGAVTEAARPGDAGPGVISRTLLAGGTPAERLAVLAIVPSMVGHKALPGNCRVNLMLMG